MSTTVSYKGATIATVSNQTKTLLTEGKYLEDDITLEDVSGGGATLITKNISANGTYNASSDSADGYSQVNVSVPASAVDSGTKNITANGNNQDVVGYAAVNVNVPNSYSAGDEGKVVSNGALVAQTSDTVTTNDTYDTTLINSLTVNVSGGGTLPRLLDHVEYTVVTDATSSSRQDIHLTPISGDRYLAFLSAKTMPEVPASGYTAISGYMTNVGETSTYTRKGSIRRPDGTIGTDGNIFYFTPSTGLFQIGGQYGTYRTGQVFDIYLFEME
ncbi:MAG: hypothetical protein IKF22_03660 [Lachnospiraceae bacterium]|nr:hypothetical protein [Oscillospiraceae bacterium]MBR3170334.1 hypothetical protein [Lachnospiraceae bacterium]